MCLQASIGVSKYLGLFLMKKISILIFSTLLTVSGVGFAHAGNTDPGRHSKFPVDSNQSRVDYRPATNQEPACEGVELEDFQGGDFIDAPLFSTLLRESEDVGFFSEPFTRLVGATQARRNGDVLFKDSDSIPPSGYPFEISGMRPSPLFITEAITPGRSSVPEASTMLLLGLGLLGLSGYGARKKFKH